MKKLVIAAGTGFLGQALVNHFKNKADKIIILTRGKAHTEADIEYVHWDAKTLTGWEDALEGADALINLAGKSVDCRYTEQNKKEIMASRVTSTAILGKAVAQCTNPPLHWLNSSTATIYRHSTDKQMDEEDGEIGSGFSINVAKTWERTFFTTQTPHTLKTALRTSIVLGKKGGALVPLKRLAQLGFGGRQGSGSQFVSWIHEVDFALAVAHIISHKMDGVVNVVAPQPVQNVHFMKVLRQAVHAPFGIPMTTGLLKFGAAIIGTETELVLKSRNVIPKRLLQNGFTFKYPQLEKALKNLVETK
jgi:uncharacterized protein (TIGR01777 family)